MVYGILQLINFAHSEVYMFGAFVAYYVVFHAAKLGIHMEPGMGLFALLLVCSMIGCSLLGLTIERFAYRPLRKAPKLNILITAIGVSLFLEYFAQVIFGADPKVFPHVLTDSVLAEIGGVQLKTSDITVLVVTVIMMIVLNFLIYKTMLGKAMRAVSTNMNVASLMGVNTDRIIAFTFIVGS